MREYSEVIRINPRHVVSRLNLGVLLIRFNRLDEAISSFKNALQIDPENQAAREYLNSALAYKAQNP